MKYWTIIEVRKLKKMREEGHTVKEIALALDKTYSSVTSYISFLDIGIHKKMSDEQKEQAIEMYQDGKSIALIARRLGYTSQTISSLMRRTGNRKKKYKMTLKEAISVLDAHQKWRRDNTVPPIYTTTNPTLLGIAIDRIIDAFKAKNESVKRCRQKKKPL